MQKSILSFIFVSICSVTVLAQINPNRVWFGLEATFQDQGMVDEKGRMTFSTPHKQAKFRAMIDDFKIRMGAPQASESFVNSLNFKPGFEITLPDGSKYITTMEPVCIEWNMRPVLVNEIAERWAPIYESAKAVGLKPYINRAAERSGMGHIHVGAESVAENPFFKNPTLLRNVLVYFHQHPSLMWGFAEAFDIGNKSNIETFHINGRQAGFEAAVAEFDEWYNKASAKERVDGGFKFLELLYNQGGQDFFYHYRLINLEHLEALVGEKMSTAGHLRGKYTVEFRGFRPYPSPEHAQALAQMLLEVFTPLAKKSVRVPFRSISDAEYARFKSALVIENDWNVVKSELGLTTNSHLEGMISEYTTNLARQSRKTRGKLAFTISPAYSEKTLKGQFFEIVLPDVTHVPTAVFNGKTNFEFQEVHDSQGQTRFVTVVYGGKDADMLTVARSIEIRSGRAFCRKMHRAM